MSKNIDQIFTANPITSNASTDLMYFGQSPYGAGNDAAMTYANFSAQFGTPYTASALTRVNDTNVTLTLGGTPGTSLLQPVLLTMGWTGQLSGARGGTGVNNGASTITVGGNFAMSGAFTFTGTLTGNTSVTFPTSGTLATTSQIPAPGFTNVNQNTSSVTLAANTRYAINNGASLVTLTLPTSPTIGDTYIIVGGSSGGWTVAQNASQQCHMGNSVTTAGVTGSLSSSNQYDCITITNVAANTFTVYGVQGNITVV